MDRGRCNPWTAFLVQGHGAGRCIYYFIDTRTASLCSFKIRRRAHFSILRTIDPDSPLRPSALDSGCCLSCRHQWMGSGAMFLQPPISKLHRSKQMSPETKPKRTPAASCTSQKSMAVKPGSNFFSPIYLHSRCRHQFAHCWWIRLHELSSCGAHRLNSYYQHPSNQQPHQGV